MAETAEELENVEPVEKPAPVSDEMVPPPSAKGPTQGETPVHLAERYGETDQWQHRHRHRAPCRLVRHPLPPCRDLRPTE